MMALKCRVVILVILIAVIAVATASIFADPLPSGTSALPKFHCYCECEKNGGPSCAMKICELQKYESRSWAASCRKQAVVPATPPAPQSSQSNHPTHRILTAER
jgi:hypothetical protein